MNTKELSLSPRAAHGADVRNLLQSHLDNCRARSGRSHRLQCWSEAVYDVIAPRLVTTAVVVVALALVIDQFV